MENKVTGHWKKQFNYDYLGDYSLDGRSEVVVTIKALDKRIVKGDKGRSDNCLIVFFNEFDKPMILTPTRTSSIQKVAGSPQIEDWIGVRVTLYVKKGVEAYGSIVDALRIRDKKPSLTKMTKEIETAMLDSVKNGKVGQVELAIPKYTMSKVQENGIMDAIKKAKK